MNDFWEKDYYDLASRHNEEAGDWKVEKTLDYLNLNLKLAEKILEAGCGTGNFAGKLKKEIFYTGIDVSEYALKEARKKFELADNRVFIKAEARKLPFKDGEFSGVVAKFSLEHFSKPKESLLEMARVLKPGGFLIIIAPNLEFPFCYPAALRHRNFLFRLKFYLTRLYDYVMRLFGRYDFRVLSDNYLKAVGRYEKKDDDLVYLVSSFEVIKFLKKKKFEFVFMNKLQKGKGLKRLIKKLITYLPGMEFYGAELFIITEKSY